MSDTFQFAIPIGREDLARKLAFAAQQHFGVEIAAFATGPTVHDAAERKKAEHELRDALRGFPHSRSYHGTFIDLSVHSDDPAIAGISRQRIQRDLETASRLGCRKIVFHTGFNPLVPVRRYEEEFVDRHAAFWPAVADQFPGITICLENMWEGSPHLFERLLRAIGHPQVRMCLDVAHAHAYGDFGVETWITRLKSRIAHMHWNDNDGDRDSHLPIGRGNVPWKPILGAAHDFRGITVVVELKSLSAIRQSLRHLAELKLPRAAAQLPLPSAATKRLVAEHQLKPATVL